MNHGYRTINTRRMVATFKRNQCEGTVCSELGRTLATGNGEQV